MKSKHRLAIAARHLGLEGLAESAPVRWARWAIDSSTHSPKVLSRSLALAGPIATVVDVGASDGRWSRRVSTHLRDATFLLFEANEVHRHSLERVAKSSKVIPVYAAASDRRGEIAFHIDKANPLGGGASSVQTETHNSLVPCTTIDHEVNDRGLAGPFMLKLDAQGHEMEILEGGAEVIKEAALIVIEAYGIDEPGRVSFDELASHMRSRGFRVAGISECMTRPSDGILWQMDLYFLPDTHPSFSDVKFH